MNYLFIFFFLKKKKTEFKRKVSKECILQIFQIVKKHLSIIKIIIVIIIKIS